MPTPSQIKAMQRAAQEDKYFTVHEVVECVSEGEEGFGEEDIPEGSRSGHPSAHRNGSERHGTDASTRRITQATFDAAVIENMDEFDMDMKSAITAAVREFELQGVDFTGVNVHALAE